MSIHILKASTQTTLDSVRTILSGIEDDGHERTLVYDTNLLTDNEYNELKKRKKGLDIRPKSSRSTPGIQIADVIVGAFREYICERKSRFLIISELLCNDSRKNLSQALG
jgi:hypothetical protein